MAKMTKKERQAAARKGARTRARNAAKKTSKKGKKSSKKGRTSRGLRVGGLHFAPKLYGKNLTPALAALGLSGKRVPILSLPPLSKLGIYSLQMTGAPTALKKKHRAHVGKVMHLEAQRLKVLKALVAATLAGKPTAELSARLSKLQDQLIAAAAFDALVASKMAGMSMKEAKKQIKIDADAEALRVGASKAQGAAASAPAQSAASGSGGGGIDQSQEMDAMAMRGIASGRMHGPVTEWGEKFMAANPLAYLRTGKKGKHRRAVNFELADRSTEGAVSVLFEPQVYKYVTMSPVPKVKKNGRHSVRKNMSKKSMRKNPLGADLAQLGKPVLGAGAGFIASRILNALALWGASKANVDFLNKPAGQVLLRLGATGAGIAATLMWADKVDMIRNNKMSVVTGMALNALDGTARTLIAPMAVRDAWSPYAASIALGGSHMGLYDVSHAGAPYSPMMGEYVAQSLNGMGYMGEYVAQSLNGMGTNVAEAAAGMGYMGEYVAQSLNGLGYAEGVDPSDQVGVDSMIDNAEAYAGLGTQVMAATAGLGTNVMAATAGLGTQVMSAAAGLYGFGDDAAPQQVTRGHLGPSGNLYNFFTQPSDPYGRRLTAVSTAQAPMPVVPISGTMPSAVPIGENISTPEGRGYAGGLFGRNVFGTMY